MIKQLVVMEGRLWSVGTRQQYMPLYHMTSVTE